MNIFIAGCARSGTTLTRTLMSCFDGVVAPGGYDETDEYAASDFESFAGQAPHIVLKRTWNCHETLPDLRGDVELLYCVRHPYDVLSSTHAQTQDLQRFHVLPDRFTAEYKAYLELRRRQPDRRVFVIRYEDLIRDPDGVQRKLGDLGLKPLHLFSENPDKIEIAAKSLEKWRQDSELLDYFASFRWPFRKVLRSFCKEFGYVLPDLPRSKASFAARLLNSLKPPGPPRPGAPRRLSGNPIIRPSMLRGDDGANINGPSLIAAPDWLPGRMGKYHLYFAHHRGNHIRLAYADRLEGPWRVHRPGTLKLAEAPMCREHIASPDVHVDEAARQIRMYFHGPATAAEGQKSFVAVSDDGIGFTPSPEVLGESYLRCIEWNGQWLGLALDGHFYRSADGLTNFERRPEPAFVFPRGIQLRHVGLRTVGNTLQIYYTRRGDIPERIWRCFADLDGDWTTWRVRDTEFVLAPERRWEGADRRIKFSRPGPADGREHALRDPAIFIEDGKAYLLYAVAGESGIAIAALPD